MYFSSNEWATKGGQGELSLIWETSNGSGWGTTEDRLKETDAHAMGAQEHRLVIDARLADMGAEFPVVVNSSCSPHRPGQGKFAKHAGVVQVVELFVPSEIPTHVPWGLFLNTPVGKDLKPWHRVPWTVCMDLMLPLLSIIFTIMIIRFSRFGRYSLCVRSCVRIIRFFL